MILGFDFAAIVVWGLITYTEDLLLFEEDFEESSHHQRLEGVLTICELTLKVTKFFSVGFATVCDDLPALKK